MLRWLVIMFFPMISVSWELDDAQVNGGEGNSDLAQICEGGSPQPPPK